MDPSEKKDELYGWLVCTVSFLGQALSMGFFYSFGTLYVAFLEEFAVGEASAAWIGSLAYCVCFLFGYVTSILCKRYGCCIVMSLGGVLYCLGFILSSFAQRISLLYFTYGFLVALGMSAAFFTSLLVLPLYFQKRLFWANGFASSGAGVGALVISPLLENMIRNYGWRIAIRVYSCSSILMIVGGLCYRRKHPVETGSVKQQLFDKTLFTNKGYLIWSFSLCLILFGYYIPYVHLVHLAEEQGVSSQKAAMLLGYISFSQSIGKMVFGKIADYPRVNRLYVYQISLLVLSVNITLCPLAKSYLGLTAFAVVFGFFDGCFCCYIFVLTSDCVKREQVNAGFGMMYTWSAVFSLLGPPFAGFVYQATGTYQLSFMVCGINLVVGICLMFLIPWFIPDEVHNEKIELTKLLKDSTVKGITSSKSESVSFMNNNEKECTPCKIDCALVPALEKNKLQEEVKREIKQRSFKTIFGEMSDRYRNFSSQPDIAHLIHGIPYTIPKDGAASSIFDRVTTV